MKGFSNDNASLTCRKGLGPKSGWLPAEGQSHVWRWTKLLDRRDDLTLIARQEHMNEGLEVWIPTESTSSLRGLETQIIRPLMDVALPGYTPSSTQSSSQVSGSSSRLKELNERLQLRSRESPARVELPSTWREQPVRSVVISSYKKNTEGRYHRHNRVDWSAAQRDRRDCFHDAAWVEYLTQPRVPEGAVHLIIGDSLLRVLTRIQSHWKRGS